MKSSQRRPTQVVVIGAGIGGLTTAAVLARAGLEVTVLEAHVYPGGCAGTFYHKGYRFDAGATLAGGFYPGGPMDLVAHATGVQQWPSHHAEPAMVVHLPQGEQITRWGDGRRWQERAVHFGADAEPFWHWQERTADALWDLALRMPPWPPQTIGDIGKLLQSGWGWVHHNPWRHLQPALLMDALHTVQHHLANQSTALRQFVDAQLLIAAQTTSAHANALYGASALDLPRRGVVHLTDGIGAIAERLAQAVERHGGTVRYRQEVTAIQPLNGQRYRVLTKRGEALEADLVVANLPPWNITGLFKGTDHTHLPPRLRNLPAEPTDGWGAFMLYVGVDGSKVPHDMALHHQIVAREPMGEGNTLFLSFSPPWDAKRAPVGQRALTISTHTALAPWWQRREHDPDRYAQWKERYSERLLNHAAHIFPWLREAVSVRLAGTPVTFQRFTRRYRGWVGGFPQTDLFRAWGPRLLPTLWMVGDSIFPGQSTAAVALGGLRVASGILAELGASVHIGTEAKILRAAP